MIEYPVDGINDAVAVEKVHQQPVLFVLYHFHNRGRSRSDDDAAGRTWPRPSTRTGQMDKSDRREPMRAAAEQRIYRMARGPENARARDRERPPYFRQHDFAPGLSGLRRRAVTDPICSDNDDMRSWSLAQQTRQAAHEYMEAAG